MKIIITEEQFKKFNKVDIESGPLGKAIKNVIINYIGENNICDIAVVYNTNTYVALILHNGPSRHDLDSKLQSFLKNIISEFIIVIINDTDCGPKKINESKNDLIKISKFISSLPRPTIDELVGDYNTGETNGDDFFWPIIEFLNYKSDNNYKRVKELILDLYRFTGALSYDDIMLLIKILEFKLTALEKNHGNKIKNVSDDSWSDLRADIVSRGEDFYNKAVLDFDLVQRMADDNDYKESFYYGIPYISDLL